jgi:hypothetical protein
MLKIGKVNRHDNYSVELRSRPTRFDKNFLKALMFALFLHGSALIIFHIGPFKFKASGYIPPAFVEADMSEKESQVNAQNEGEGKLLRFPFMPKLSQPELAKIPKLTESSNIEPLKVVDYLSHPFLKIERELQYDAYFLHANETLKTNGLQVSTSGLLRDIDYEANLKSYEKFMSKSFKAIYAVKVENQSGKIFYYERENLEGQVDAPVLENLLKNIRFEKKSLGFQTSLHIEIVYTKGDSSND